MDKPKTDDREEIRKIERVGCYSFFVNLGLAGFVGTLAYLSGSLAIAASSVDAATDCIASLAVWVGLKLSTRKTRAFPYGLYKIENVIQIIMAMLIFFAGFEIARKVVLPATSSPAITPWIIGGMGASAFVPLLFGYYTIVIGRRTGSPALLADGRHRQADVLSLVVVFAAVVSNYFGLSIGSSVLTIDRIAAGLVLIFIGYAGWELLVNGMRVLLDASIDSQTLAQVRKIIESESAVTEIRSLVGRNAGRYRFLEADIVLRTGDLEKAHAISRRLKTAIREKVSHVDRMLIHYEPSTRETVVVAVPLESNRETASEHFGEAPLFYLAVVRASDGELLEERFAANPFLNEKKAKGIKVGKWLLEKGLDRLYTAKDLSGRGAGYVLSDAGVEVVALPASNLGEIRRRLRTFATSTENAILKIN